ncbi:MAG: UDP-4-amino-4,6-dideoxy-N-acetyl-beta-L-altrosamine transaminase [Acidobacteria bacterium]|nr:MAG: UDP-4-amino-4,6-dideoxy-N-acetyl-beta-L-altrosamine transaminase [Acidobacteriota bacterium]
MIKTERRTRKTFLPFALPDTDATEIAGIIDAVRSGWITTGPKTHEFELEFAAYVGAKHAVAVNSCTAAMHLALEATGLHAGDLVLTTPYTFAATAEVIRYFDAVPVFVDVEPGTLNMDPGLAAQAIYDLTQTGSAAQRWLPKNSRHSNSNVRRVPAILPVHFAGLPAELEALYPVAAEHGLTVIEDAAHAFPARCRGRLIGQDLNANSKPHASRFTCFSFYATKTITSGEGGMICTDNDAWAERCRIMALHGISRDAWKRYTAEGSWYYEITAPGYKYNMTDIAAAIGLAQLRKAERMWQRRREIALRYNEAFGALPELQIPADRTDCQHAWHLYILRLNLDRLCLDRAQFIQELKQLNIGTSVHFIPLHLHPYYRETYGYAPIDFPVAFQEYQRVVSLPLYSKMSDEDVTDVIQAVSELVSKFRIKRAKKYKQKSQAVGP